MTIRKNRKYSPEETKKFRSYLKKNMTKPERKLWARLWKRQMGVKFRPQVIIDGYIVDFYCHSASLIIEIDGSSHDDQVDYDLRRTKYLEERGDRNRTVGMYVLRFTNEQVMKDVDVVVETIRTELDQRIPLVQEKKSEVEYSDRHYRDILSDVFPS